MYELMVERDFVAQHFLTVPDCGPENEWHSHHFKIQVQLEGETLNEHGYLVDIVEVKDGLDAIVGRYKDRTLNDLPEFDGKNPSIEHFARITAESLGERLTAGNLTRLTVRLWEDDEAWASYGLGLSSSRSSSEAHKSVVE